MTIHLRFPDRAAALTALAPLGLTAPDSETGEADFVTTAYPGVARVDLVLLGGTGRHHRQIGVETIDDPIAGPIEVPVMVPVPGFHVDLLWSGGAVPDFGEAVITPASPSSGFVDGAAAAVGVGVIPTSVSRFQARAALREAGLIDAVDAAVSGADPITREAWASAAVFERGSPTIATLATALGLDEAALDTLFVRAAAIVA